ncbi:MAG: class B sortase [Clostridia bacterium]|nr:class B sortase [Clostridia bacterium]
MDNNELERILGEVFDITDDTASAGEKNKVPSSLTTENTENRILIDPDPEKNNSSNGITMKDFAEKDETNDDGVDDKMKNEVDFSKVNDFLESLDNLTPDQVAADAAGEKKKKSRIASFGIVRILIILLCFGVFGYCAYQLVDIGINYKLSDDLYDDIADKYREAMRATDEGGERVLRLPAVGIDKPMKNYADVLATGAEIYVSPEHDIEHVVTMRFQRFLVYLEDLRQENPDTYGYIDIAGTKISYPVVQGTDNEYYLRHAFNGSYLKAGAVFADHRNSRWIECNRNTVFYGHNLQNGSMFHQLEEYLNEDFFMSTPVEVSTYDGIYTFEVFSVYRTKMDYQYFETDFSSDEEFLEFCKEAEKNSLFHKEGITFEADDKLLTLSTCITGDSSGRYAIHAKLVKVET